MIMAVAHGEIPSHELAWATRKAGIAAAAAQERGFAELQRWIDTSLGPVVRACRELLSCLNQPMQELGPVEVVDRAEALSRDGVYRPLAGHCAHQICQTLGYPIGSWGLSQKIFQRNFDLHGQIKWITSVRLKREQIQLIALDAVVRFVFDSGNRLTEQHFLEERHGQDL